MNAFADGGLTAPQSGLPLLLDTSRCCKTLSFIKQNLPPAPHRDSLLLALVLPASRFLTPMGVGHCCQLQPWYTGGPLSPQLTLRHKSQPCPRDSRAESGELLPPTGLSSPPRGWGLRLPREQRPLQTVLWKSWIVDLSPPSAARPAYAGAGAGWEGCTRGAAHSSSPSNPTLG